MKERSFEHYIVQEKNPKTGKWKERYKWFNTLDDAKAAVERDKIDYPNHPFSLITMKAKYQKLELFIE